MDALQLDREIPSLEQATTLSDEDKAFLRDVARRVRTVAPEAELMLYGSRARGDAREDSDWDILVVLPERPDRTMRNRLFHATEAYGYDERTYLRMIKTYRERYEREKEWSAFLYNVHDDAIRL